MASGLEGINKLSRQLSDMGQKVGGRALRSAVNAAVNPALKAARNAAPVGTNIDWYPVKAYDGLYRGPGHLKRNIGKKTFMSRDKTKAYAIVGPKPAAFYGTSFVELGTSKLQKRPWLEPAFRSAQPEMAAALKAKLKEVIDRLAK